MDTGNMTRIHNASVTSRKFLSFPVDLPDAGMTPTVSVEAHLLRLGPLRCPGVCTNCLCINGAQRTVGGTPVFGRRTDHVLRSTFS